MWVPSSTRRRRRVPFPCIPVLLFLVSVIQIWVCCHDCQARAIRAFPGNGFGFGSSKGMLTSAGSVVRDQEMSLVSSNGGPAYSGNTTSSTTQQNQGLEESKRRVPSCPDPLHN